MAEKSGTIVVLIESTVEGATGPNFSPLMSENSHSEREFEDSAAARKHLKDHGVEGTTYRIARLSDPITVSTQKVERRVLG